jgi:hypothetical protein
VFLKAFARQIIRGKGILRQPLSEALGFSNILDFSIGIPKKVNT